jgi:L-histidine N-alpha-methyltransferase
MNTVTSTAKNQEFEQVYLHSSQFPDQVYRDYLTGFKQQKIPHKFHYDSVKQSQKWLKIHQVYSPSRNDQNCVVSYEKCFAETANIVKNSAVIEVIGLGSGGGTKDTLLLSQLSKTNHQLFYYPIDVSLSLSVISAQKARSTCPQVLVKPVVCDLLHADDLIKQIDYGTNNQNLENSQKIITFFGMIPNFTPDEIMPILSNFLNKGDILLLSANLAPGDDYLAGINQVIHQYDNQLTKDWLMTILTDVGITDETGKINFSIEPDHQLNDLSRIIAHFELATDINFPLQEEQIIWHKGDKVQLFFSYRYTTAKVKKVLSSYQIQVLDYWEAPNQQEAVYICQKN